ncbi:MAG: hypothetical protein D6729_11975 [Deltaproteobacteria bacterium]|nr:MAG: hypothetical protein D6729_11975 [Deltaproteobacteria bacterium]
MVALVTTASLACGRVEFGVPPLGSGGADAGTPDAAVDAGAPDAGGDGGEACTKPAECPPFSTYPYARDPYETQVFPTLKSAGCLNGGCHDFRDPPPDKDPNTFFLLYPDPTLEAQWSLNLRRTAEQVDAYVSGRESDPLNAPLLQLVVRVPVTAHNGLTWTEADPTPYQPILDWMEAAKTTRNCYESGFATYLGTHDRSAFAGCSPAAEDPCWPEPPMSCEVPDGGTPDGGPGDGGPPDGAAGDGG